MGVTSLVVTVGSVAVTGFFSGGFGGAGAGLAGFSRSVTVARPGAGAICLGDEGGGRARGKQDHYSDSNARERPLDRIS